ncbi:hypothetical protein BV22DRAFT_1026233, partial [Leucogyrophana mollusca]
RAVRYNILVNPSGMQGKARALDWVVESNNLHTKHTFGGRGSNYTKQRVLEESPLIQVYRSCHANMERNLSLPGPTTKHAEPNLAKTLTKMTTYMRDHKANEFQAGRNSMYSIPDMIDKGQDILYSSETPDDDDDDVAKKVVEAEDLAAVDT